MPKTIIIAEDDKYISKLYRLNLEQEGWNVLHACDGEEALKLLDDNKPDLLILDLLMPKVDGFSVLKKMHEKKASFPIIVLSNVSEDVDVDECKKYGAKEYVVKSDLDLQGLIDMVKKYV